MYKILAKTLFVGKKIVFMPSCHSTNDVASQLVDKEKIEEGTIIITDNQTRGRGQLDNKWEAEPKMNLTFSIILRPHFITAADQFFLNIVPSLAVFEYLDLRFPSKVKIKWPNDILCEGKKVCGILVKNFLRNKNISYSVVGIGLNINQIMFENPWAISMYQMDKVIRELDVELETLCHIFEKYYLMLKSGKENVLKNNYIQYLYGLHEWVLFKTQDSFRGKIIGIDEQGKLGIESEGIIKYYNFREVAYIR